MSERGIVITPRFEFDGQTLTFPRGFEIEAEDLRRYLLYWDKIDYPDNNLLGTSIGPDEQFLIEQGVLNRTKVRLQGSVEHGYVFAQAHALQVNNHREPGLWSMAQTGSTVFLPSEVSHETGAIEIELYNALPVPSGEVSLNDILLLKDERNAELLALRGAMDRLYLEVIDTSDIPRARTAALDELERTLRDLQKVISESWASRLLSSMKVELNIPTLATSAAAGYVAAPSILDISPAVGAALGATAAAIKFEFRLTQKANALPPELKDFAYLHHMHRELTA